MSDELVVTIGENSQSRTGLSQHLSVGIDIGGTNIDAVLLDGKNIIAFAKVPTTADIKQGVTNAINALFQKISLEKRLINKVMVGTTHFVNTVLQCKGLNPVLTVRIGRPATTAAKPLLDWPKELRHAIGGYHKVIHGGHEYNGAEIAPLDVNKLKALAEYAKRNAINAAAVIGVFANVNPSHEQQAASVLREVFPELHISLSHEIGGLNLLPRENATILNAALSQQFHQFKSCIKQAMSELGLADATLFFSSNDGTLENPDYLFPIATYGSGPSNSMRGAMELIGKANALVADIGGTSTDIGILKDGYPLESGHEVKVGNEKEGISCNFAAPLTRSGALGGGSIITISKDEKILIGPDSVGYRLNQEAYIFGGNTLTVTDIAVAKGRLKLGHVSLLARISADLIDIIDRLIHLKFVEMVHQTLPFVKSDDAIPLILVGGGATLFDRNLLKELLCPQLQQIIIPEYAGCANALGAGVAKLSGSFNGVFQYTDTPGTLGTPRNEAIEIAREKAAAIAVAKGAHPDSIIIQNIDEMPINYLPGNQTRVSIKVIGEMNISKSNRKVIQPEYKTQSSSLKHITQALAPSSQATSHAVNQELSISQKTLSFVNNKSSANNCNEVDITHMALGTGFLGSGGGGSTLMGEMVVKKAIRDGIKIKIATLAELPDESLVVAVGVMGAPTVLAEKLPSKQESIAVIQKMEEILQTHIDYVVAMEIGGMNGLYALYMSAIIGRPIIDADCMGRALPEIQMVTPNIYGNIKCVAVLANGKECHSLIAESMMDLEMKARQKTTEMGGIVTLAYLPMKGKEAKQLCVPHSLSVSQRLGKSLSEAREQNIVTSLNASLEDKQYGPAEMLIKGKIIDLVRSLDQGFNKGWIIIYDDENKVHVRVDFQNENLRAVDIKLGKVLALAPKIITLIDNELKPISCESLRVGLDVIALSLQVPEILRTPKASAVIGADAFHLEEIEADSYKISGLLKTSFFGMDNRKKEPCALLLKAEPTRSNFKPQ